MNNRFFYGLALAALLLLSQGCTLIRAEQDIKQLDRAAEIRGGVIGGSTGKPVIVELIRKNRGTMEVWNHYVRYGSGTFRFLLPAGRYFLFAFEDCDKDLAYQKDEPAAWYGGTKHVKIVLKEGEKLEGLFIVLSEEIPEDTDKILSRKQAEAASVTLGSGITVARGEVVGLDDARFAKEKGKQGFWQPLQFAREQGFGIYFLEPYDPAKIPVLFVHGAAGSPRDFRTIIDHLDRKRFQPWVYQYPSGLRLDVLGDELVKALIEIYARQGIDRLFIIAHSMGGLVSRAAINEIVDQYPDNPIRLFISISTPWDGVDMAKTGVDYSPVVIPSWIDVVPDSAFLRKLFEKPLPGQISFYLLFGVVGGDGTDGSVPLTSEISLRAQADAVRIYGYPEDHMSILKSDAVIKRINDLLQQAVR